MSGPFKYLVHSSVALFSTTTTPQSQFSVQNHLHRNTVYPILIDLLSLQAPITTVAHRLLCHQLHCIYQRSINHHTPPRMRSTFATLALAALTAASPVPQGVTSAITPSSSPPAGCSGDYSGTFEIQVVNVTSSGKRSIEKVSTQHCHDHRTLLTSSTETTHRPRYLTVRWCPPRLTRPNWLYRREPTIPIRQPTTDRSHLHRWIFCLRQWLPCNWW